MKYIAYLRVSTLKQDYGLDAQINAIDKWVKNKGDIIATFQEKMSGKINKRPELEKAIELCKKESAILLISKLDRLSRDIAFLFKLRDSGVNIACCELPELNTLTLGIFATMAQHERELISARTIAGLQVAIGKGKKIGRRKGDYRNPIADRNRVEQVKIAKRNLAITHNGSAIVAAKHFKKQNLNNRIIAFELNSLGFTAPRGGNLSSKQVARLLLY